MKEIYLLTDYKGFFGSKWNALPYRSGFNLDLINKAFYEYDYLCTFIKVNEINKIYKNLRNKIILYTSTEDIGYHYKEYIEDVIYFIEGLGNKVIPSYKYLKATNNKVYMEFIRKELGYKWNDNLKSWCLGTYEDIFNLIDEIKFPIVIKESQGAQSRQVYLAKNKKDLIKKIKKITKTSYLLHDIKDRLRPLKHKDYVKESYYRKKYILQSFIPNLRNDWKILIYGDKYYILYRGIKPGNFKASGSGYNYKFGSNAKKPKGIFDFAKNIFDTLKVPALSLDIAYDGQNFYLIEFQAVYFGTSVFIKSDVFYSKVNNEWVQKNNKDSLEKTYVDSIIWYINNQ